MVEDDSKFEVDKFHQFHPVLHRQFFIFFEHFFDVEDDILGSIIFDFLEVKLVLFEVVEADGSSRLNQLDKPIPDLLQEQLTVEPHFPLLEMLIYDALEGNSDPFVSYIHQFLILAAHQRSAIDVHFVVYVLLEGLLIVAVTFGSENALKSDVSHGIKFLFPDSLLTIAHFETLRSIEDCTIIVLHGAIDLSFDFLSASLLFVVLQHYYKLSVPFI
jgi:hypothetical protein